MRHFAIVLFFPMDRDGKISKNLSQKRRVSLKLAAPWGKYQIDLWDVVGQRQIEQMFSEVCLSNCAPTRRPQIRILIELRQPLPPCRHWREVKPTTAFSFDWDDPINMAALMARTRNRSASRKLFGVGLYGREYRLSKMRLVTSGRSCLAKLSSLRSV